MRQVWNNAFLGSTNINKKKPKHLKFDSLGWELQKNSAETQQLGHTPGSGPKVQNREHRAKHRRTAAKTLCSPFQKKLPKGLDKKFAP